MRTEELTKAKQTIKDLKPEFIKEVYNANQDLFIHKNGDVERWVGNPPTTGVVIQNRYLTNKKRIMEILNFEIEQC
jgi:hypothetical protein